MVVASYLITSTHMRIKDERSSRFIGPPNGATPYNTGRFSLSTLKERAELVFQMVPEKMKNLVIVNSTLAPFEMIQACVEMGDKYADNVMVIPPLLASLTYALEDLSNFRNPPPKEVLLVATITSKFIEFVILRRDENFKLFVAAFEHFEVLEQCQEKFLKCYNYHYPHATIIIVHDAMQNVAEELQNRFKPENCFIKTFKKWDFVLLVGGIHRAMEDSDGFDTRYHIANFSSGYETSILDRRTRKLERHILLPERSSLPCNIHGFNGVGQLINVYYSPEYYQAGNDLISFKRPAIKHTVFSSGSTKDIIGFVDERGIPYAKDSIAFKTLKVSKVSETEKQDPVQVDILKSDKDASDAMPQLHQNPEPDATVFSPQPSSSTVSKPPQITFVFRDNFYAIEVLRKEISRILTDSDGKGWTPLYLSLVESTVEIGEIAKTNFEKFPKSVIYDVFEIIGKPLNEVKINPKWGFDLVEKEGIVHFQIETLSGPRLIPQEIVISAFLKAMKLQTESMLGIAVKEITLSINFKLTESQKAIFEKAAAKNNLKILKFV